MSVAKDGEVRAHGEPHDGELIRSDTQFDVHQYWGSLRNALVRRRPTGMMSDTRGARRRICRVRPRSKCPGLPVPCYNVTCPSWSEARGEEVFHRCNCRHLAGSVGIRLRSCRRWLWRSAEQDWRQGWRKCLLRSRIRLKPAAAATALTLGAQISLDKPRFRDGHPCR